jgi:hypothetical protein
MPKTKRALVLTLTAVAIVTAVLFAFTGRGIPAQAAPASGLFSMIPPGAPTIGFIDFSAVRESRFYMSRPDHSPITGPSSEYANFVQATGFDFEKDLDRVVLASWPKTGSAAEGKTIVVAEGRFNSAKIRDYAVQHGKLDQQQGHEVFSFPGQVTGARNSLVFLDDHHIAIVQGTTIAPMFEAYSHDTTDPMQERIARVNGAAAFVIVNVLGYPDFLLAQNSGTASFAAPLARTLQWITLALAPEGENVRVSLDGETKTSSDAQQLQSSLELLRQFLKGALDSPNGRRQVDPAAYAAMQTLLGRIEIKDTDGRVRVLVELTPDIWNLSTSPKAR